MLQGDHLDGYILITSCHGQKGRLRTFRLNEELWIITDWQSITDFRNSWPSKILRPPSGFVRSAKGTAKHRYELNRPVPISVLLSDCPLGDYQGFTVRKVLKP